VPIAATTKIREPDRDIEADEFGKMGSNGVGLGVGSTLRQLDVGPPTLRTMQLQAISKPLSSQ
jgi:hypothetical protein